MNLSQAQNIYMIGIKGVGMTALAQILKQQGKNVSGSDTDEKFFTDQVLQKAGIQVEETFKASNLPSGTDLVIFSSAYDDNNPEIKAAKEQKLPLLAYAEALGELTKINKSIAVAGSHGKTTISAMLAFVLKEAGLSPTAVVGSRVPQWQSNVVIGSGEWLVFEADEYQNKFNYFSPQAVVLTSIDWDHPDFFKTPESYFDAFVDFLKKIPSDGFVVVNYDSELVRQAVAEANLNSDQIVSYGLTSGYWRLMRMWLDQGHWHFSANGGEEFLGDFWLKLVGSHNVSNALAVLACASRLGVELEMIRQALAEFEGTSRRFEFKARLTNSTQIIDDYAHHPTEIQVTLKAARDFFPYKNIRVVFHPHTFSRTKALLSDFGTSFKSADEVIVLDIYASARESGGEVTSEQLVQEIKKHHPNVVYQPKISDAVDYLAGSLTRSDLVITMGAGDVWKVGEELMKKFGVMAGNEF
ncbi:MAG: UDP-N-acetylmuramate--L-alanine ligase [Patescibacteria group bacterium]